MRFLKKYRLIIGLVMVIVILAFIKFYIGNNNITQEQINITPTMVVKKQTNTIEQDDLKSSNNVLIEKYYALQTEEEKEKFFNTLTEEQQAFLSNEESIDNSLDNNLSYGEESIKINLKKSLPYETETFKVNKYINPSVLSVKAKGDNFIRSKNDLMQWLEENADNPNDIVLVWEEDN